MKTKLGLLFSIFTVMCVGFSSCKEDSKDNPSPGNGELNGHEYVDLGLPGHVMWATCNVGASRPEDYGLYFAWGETKGYAKGDNHSFDWKNYKWCNGSEDSMSKYCTDASFGIVDNKTVLDAADDAATANWGAGWRMPTEQEIIDLGKYCTVKWINKNYVIESVTYYVAGMEVKSKSNGNSIFLPATGYLSGTKHYEEGLRGEYWLNSLDASKANEADYTSINSSFMGYGSTLRYFGFCVRPVCVVSK